MLVIDGDNLTITLDAGVTEVDVLRDIYTPWKEWLLDPVFGARNRGYPKAFNPDGGNPLSSIIDQGAYTFLNNVAGWRLKPPEEDITIYLTGNLAVYDTSFPAFTPTDGGFTAAILGLQPVTQGVTPVMGRQLAYGAFQNAITLDVTSPWSGIGNTPDGDPIGTPAHPVNNISDLLLLCTTWGMGTVNIVGDAALSDSGDYTGINFVGESRTKTILLISTSAQVDECEFYYAHVKGTLDGDSLLYGSKVDNLSYVNGEIEKCELAPGIIVLGGGAAASIINCWSGVPGVDSPTVDMGGSGQSLGMRGYDGGIRLINKTGPESVSIDLAAGQVKIDLTTVTNGVVVCRGDGKVIDDDTGEYLVTGNYGSLFLLNETANPFSTAAAVWDEVHGKMIYRAHYNRRYHDKVAGTITIFDTDNVTPLHVFDADDELLNIVPQ